MSHLYFFQIFTVVLAFFSCAVGTVVYFRLISFPRKIHHILYFLLFSVTLVTVILMILSGKIPFFLGLSSLLLAILPLGKGGKIFHLVLGVGIFLLSVLECWM